MKEFANETDAHRYTMRLDGTLVGTLDYAVNGSAISFTRSFTNPQFRGNGYASELVEFAANDVERTSERRIIPMCWYVGDWFTAHPERAGLLTR
jgi:predicted GNAT family acetyltransferase